MPRLIPIHHQALVKCFRNCGYEIARKHGSHLVMTKDGTPRPLVIPMYPEVPVRIIKGLLASAGLSRGDYFKLLSK